MYYIYSKRGRSTKKQHKIKATVEKANNKILENGKLQRCVKEIFKYNIRRFNA